MPLPSPAPRWFRTICLVTVCCSSLCAAATAAERPNIVLIISDDQAWTDYGFMSHETIETPHLDRLASESVVFERGYVPTGLCRPSLMTLIISCCIQCV